MNKEYITLKEVVDIYINHFASLMGSNAFSTNSLAYEIIANPRLYSYLPMDFIVDIEPETNREITSHYPLFCCLDYWTPVCPYFFVQDATYFVSEEESLERMKMHFDKINGRCDHGEKNNYSKQTIKTGVYSYAGQSIVKIIHNIIQHYHEDLRFISESGILEKIKIDQELIDLKLERGSIDIFNSELEIKNKKIKVFIYEKDIPILGNIKNYCQKRKAKINELVNIHLKEVKISVANNPLANASDMTDAALEGDIVDIGVHLSPFMKLAHYVINKMNINHENQPSKVDIEEELKGHANKFAINNLTPHLASNIATIIREIDSQKGGNKKQTKKK